MTPIDQLGQANDTIVVHLFSKDELSECFSDPHVDRFTLLLSECSQDNKKELSGAMCADDLSIPVLFYCDMLLIFVNLCCLTFTSKTESLKHVSDKVSRAK